MNNECKIKLQFKGREAKFERAFIEDQGIDVKKGVFEFNGVYYRPLKWSENTDELCCRILEPVE